jgi:uncharacterized protein YjbI with pentapeptide repeats
VRQGEYLARPQYRESDVQIRHVETHEVLLDLPIESLVGSELSGLELFLADLHGVDASRADLRQTNLGRCDLRGACLRNANMMESDLTLSLLDGADFHNANLRSSRLLAITGSAQFCDCNLDGADFRFSAPTGSSFAGASLVGADLSRGNFTGVNFYGADLTDANLRYANLTGAQLSHASLRGAAMQGTMLSHAALEHADLSLTTFSDVTLAGARLADSIWSHTAWIRSQELAQTTGLAEVEVRGPVAIDLPTLRHVARLVTDEVLAACNVSRDELRRLLST